MEKGYAVAYSGQYIGISETLIYWFRMHIKFSINPKNKNGVRRVKVKKCTNCGSTEFAEGTDYSPIKPNKMSFGASNKIYTFCLECGEVVSIRIENTSLFKKKS